MTTTVTKRVTSAAAGGKTPRIAGAATASHTQRVTESALPSELALEGDVGHGTLLLDGDMAPFPDDDNLLLEGDMQSRALSALFTKRVTL